MVSTCDPTRVVAGQQTVVAYDFMPSLALAVRLGIGKPSNAGLRLTGWKASKQVGRWAAEPRAVIAAKFAALRQSAKVYGTTWQLNGKPLESVSPRFWWPTDRSEPAVDADGFALRTLAAPVNSDWQIFR